MVKIRTITIIIALIIGSYLAIFQADIIGMSTVDRPTISIATWNIQNFGQKKATDNLVMKDIGKLIEQYDIVAIQEISNVNELNDSGCSRNDDACPGEKCSLVKNALLANIQKNVSIITSPQVKDERYMIVYDQTKIQLVGEPYVVNDPSESGHFCNLKLNDTGLMLRQPLVASFSTGTFDFTLMTAHTSPDNNEKELEGLSQFFDRELVKHPNLILLGDLNLDCSYEPDSYSLSKHILLVSDSMDTTVSRTDCTYDQIIIPRSLKEQFSGKVGVNSAVTKSMSDHYLVWAEFFI